MRLSSLHPITSLRSAGGLLLCLLPFTAAKAQTLIIPQIADGGAWQTTIVLTNTSGSPVSASLSFFEETGGGMTQPWNLQFLEASSTENLSLPAAGTLILHSQDNPSAPTSVGWAQLQRGSAVSAYAIFTQTVPGRQNQDGTAPAAASATRVLVPFDNSGGFVTTVAIANTTGSNETIAVGLQPTSGPSSQLSPITLPAQGHAAFALPTQFGATNGISGTLEFYAATGSFSLLALRFNPTGAFTAAPVYEESGSPIIGAAGPTGSFPQFSTLEFFSSQSSNAQTGVSVSGSLTVVAGVNLSCSSTAGTTTSLGTATLQGTVFFGGFNVTGLTVTCTGLEVTASNMLSFTGATLAQITSASLTFTLSPETVATSGTISGSVNLVSTVGTIKGSFTGTYVAQ